MKEKMKVGDTIFYRALSSRRGNHASLKESKIVSVGKKYFTISPNYLGRFHIDTLMHDGGQYSSNYKAYLTKEEYEVEHETGRLKDKLRIFFSNYTIKLRLRKLAQIEAIIESEED